MKSVLSFFIVVAVVGLFAGCYTELATVERNDQEYAYDADTISENGNTTINNHYYLDDDYRRSRLRVSFNYYYPTYSSWISSYYFSYFNDPYWGMYYRPMGYYDPFYPYYPPYGWCYYPSPYYDPWHPYYPVVSYYPGYYPPTVYANNPAAPNRPRDGGSTRDPVPDDRSRPLPSTLPMTEPPTGVISTQIRQREPAETTPSRSPEKPWWEKVNTDRQTRIADEDRQKENVPANNPRIKQREKTQVDDQPTYTPQKNVRPEERTKRDDAGTTTPKAARPTERSKREEPGYTPPVKKSEPKESSRPAERSRQTRESSYSPPRQSSPPQSAPPQSAPARGNSGAAPQGGNDRKRD